MMLFLSAVPHEFSLHCDSVERIETVVGRACERARLHIRLPSQLSCESKAGVCDISPKGVEDGSRFSRQHNSDSRISAIRVRPHDQIECPTLSMRSRSSCEDQPVSQVISLLQVLHIM